MEHQYFDAIRDLPGAQIPYTETPRLDKSEFVFEEAKTMTKEMLREVLYQEIEHYHPDLRAEWCAMDAVYASPPACAFPDIDDYNGVWCSTGRLLEWRMRLLTMVGRMERLRLEQKGMRRNAGEGDLVATQKVVSDEVVDLVATSKRCACPENAQ